MLTASQKQRVLWQDLQVLRYPFICTISQTFLGGEAYETRTVRDQWMNFRINV